MLNDKDQKPYQKKAMQKEQDTINTNKYLDENIKWLGWLHRKEILNESAFCFSLKQQHLFQAILIFLYVHFKECVPKSTK